MKQDSKQEEIKGKVKEQQLQKQGWAWSARSCKNTSVSRRGEPGGSGKRHSEGGERRPDHMEPSHPSKERIVF